MQNRREPAQYVDDNRKNSPGLQDLMIYLRKSKMNRGDK